MAAEVRSPCLIIRDGSAGDYQGGSCRNCQPVRQLRGLRLREFGDGEEFADWPLTTFDCDHRRATDSNASDTGHSDLRMLRPRSALICHSCVSVAPDFNN
jgi:hypothetical protein